VAADDVTSPRGLRVEQVSQIVNKTVALNKSSSEDYFREHTNITTKLEWKLFTKVIKMPSVEAWV
jgi:hypothetical protein